VSLGRCDQVGHLPGDLLDVGGVESHGRGPRAARSSLCVLAADRIGASARRCGMDMGSQSVSRAAALPSKLVGLASGRRHGRCASDGSGQLGPAQLIARRCRSWRSCQASSGVPGRTPPQAGAPTCFTAGERPATCSPVGHRFDPGWLHHFDDSRSRSAPTPAHDRTKTPVRFRSSPL
jgi:hypothetical protein